MPRPKSKNELLQLSKNNFKKRCDRVEGFSREEQEKAYPLGSLNRNLLDVLVHLHHWHNTLMRRYEEGMSGEKPAQPATGYTWKTMPDLIIGYRNIIQISI